MLLQALCSASYPMVNSNWSYSPETPNLGQIRRFLEPCDLEIWRMTFKNNRAPLLCYFKLCASFRSHLCIQTGVTVRKHPIWVNFRRFLEPCDLEIWRMTLKNNRAPLLCCFQLCAWFHCHMWIQTGVRVRKRLSWVLTSVTLTFDLWPRPFAWTSLLTILKTPEHFMMIRWWEHGEKGKSEGFESCDRPIVRKRPIRVKSGDVLSRVTLKFDGWLWKTIGHLSFAVSSFVQHFITISEFKLELLSRNAQFR